MARPRGLAKTGGRQAGTPNKRTQDVVERLEGLDCDPIAGMANIAADALTEGNLALAGQMYKELAQYVYPKRKALELTEEDEAEPVTEVIFRRVDASKPE